MQNAMDKLVEIAREEGHRDPEALRNMTPEEAAMEIAKARSLPTTLRLTISDNDGNVLVHDRIATPDFETLSEDEASAFADIILDKVYDHFVSFDVDDKQVVNEWRDDVAHDILYRARKDKRNARERNTFAGYHKFHREEDGSPYGSFQVFWADENIPFDPEDEVACLAPGWYWWSCFPGCLPDSEPNGPFESSAEALLDADPHYFSLGV